MPKRPKACTTVGQASLALSHYESLNSDLPKEIRRQMAPFVLLRTCSQPAIEDLFQAHFHQTLHKHRCWLWWMALSTSSLSHHFPPLARLHNEEGVCTHHLYTHLHSILTKEEWSLFLRRLGYSTNVYPSRFTKHHPHHTPPAYYYSEGGAWPTSSPITQVIWDGAHIPRDYSYNTTTAALGEEKARLLELELQSLINPSALLHPDAVNLALSHVRSRIPTLVGWPKRDKAGWTTVSWFFQTRIPTPKGWVAWFFGDPRARAYTARYTVPISWEWFTPYEQ